MSAKPHRSIRLARAPFSKRSTDAYKSESSLASRETKASHTNMTKCVLLICICSIVFAGQGETSASPVRGFIGLNTLRRKAVLLYNSAEQFQQQRIFPSMNFSCSGTISKWTFVARSQTGRNRDQYPLFQLWRPSGTGRYERVYESSSDSGTFTMSDVSGITTGEYLPHDPVTFHSGYILGVYHLGESRLSVIHASVPSGFGRDSYFRRTGTSLAVFNISGALVGNDEPLVAVNTTSPQCVQGLLNEEAIRIAADVYATRDTFNVRTHERQQRIIPGIKFTCTGALTKWIIGARRTLTQPTNHPQLQIWRQRQGSSNTYDRTTFSDITALNTTDDLNVYEYIPNPPLQLQANDILGLYQPHRNNTQVVMYYQTGSGPRNFARFNQNSPVTSGFTTGNGVDNNLPLVAIKVNGRSAGSCTEGFITRERLADEALLIGDFTDTYGRQLIIPNMTFTSSGSVVRWTFVARYRASATQYPELQVWRENTTGTYVKVVSTGNMEPAQTAYLNVYEYLLDPPLQVMAGDVLGIYQPSSGNSRVHLLCSDDSSLVNWYIEVSRPQDSFVVGDSQTNNVLPLVAVSFEPEAGAVTYTPTVSYPTPVTHSPTLSSLPSQLQSMHSLPVSTIIILSTVIPSTLVLLMLVCTVVVIILIVRWRITRKQVDAAHEHTGSTELNVSAPHKTALEHFEMNTNDAYGTNTAEIATTENVAYMTAEIATTENVAYMTAEMTTTENVAYMTAEDAIPATQNVAYGQVPPGTA